MPKTKPIDPLRYPYSAIATATVPVIATDLPSHRRTAVFQILEVINRHAATIHDARMLLEYAHVTIDTAIDYRERTRRHLES
jgi:hypothetical protein